METEWKAAFDAAIQADFLCRECGFELLAEKAGDSLRVPGTCPSCSSPVSGSIFLMADSAPVSLRPFRELGRGFTRLASERDPVVARVEAHPRKPEIIGLKNLGEEDWQAAPVGGSVYRVPPGKAVRIDHGTSIVSADGTATMISVEEAAA